LPDGRLGTSSNQGRWVVKRSDSEAAFWRSVSRTLLERHPELSRALSVQELTGRALVDILVADGLISADDLYEAVMPAARRPREHGNGVVYMLPRAGRYGLVEGPGPTPTRGELVELDGDRFLVTRVGRSPLPFDSRACVFLTKSEARRFLR
jgi:hypothetical protein